VNAVMSEQPMAKPISKPQITVKTNEETLERFNVLKKRLKDNGLTNVDQDAINLLMDNFEDMGLAKTLDFGPAFKELSQLVARITEIFSNQAKQFQTDKDTREREQEARLNELQGKFDKAIEESNLYKDELKLKEGEVQDLKETTAKHDKEKEELEKRIEEQGTASRSWETNYHNANKELEKVKEENLKMKGELDKVNKLKASLSDMERNKGELERILKEQKNEHKNEIGRIKNDQNEKHMNALMELQNKHNGEIKQAQHERDQQVSKLNDKVSELQDKYQKSFESLKTLEVDHEKLKVKFQQELESQSLKKEKPKDDHPKPTTRTKKSESTLS
jgi:chromosome segregation ATPase